MDTTNTTEQSSLPNTAPSGPVDTKKFTLKINKKLLIALAVIIVLVALAIFYKNIFVAAVVNNKPISRVAVIKELERQSGQTALEALINERLITDEAKKQKVEVTEDELNAEIKKLEDQFASQQGSLDEELEHQGLTRDDVKKQIRIQKQAEKLLADKIKVEDSEIATYITENEITVPAGEEENYKNQIREQIKSQKFSSEVATWLSSLRSAANVRIFTNY